MSGSTSDGSSSTARSRSRSSSPLHRAITSVATQLPIALVSARPSLITRSMPTISAIPTAIASRAEELAAERLQRRRERHQAGARDTRRALRRQHHQRRQPDLRADPQLLPARLDDEQRAQGEVDAGAVEVERVAGRITRPTVWRDAPADSSFVRNRGSTVSDDDVPRDDQQLVLDQPDQLPAR